MNLLSANDVATLKDTTRQTVYKAIKADEIDAVLVGSSYVVKDNARLRRWAPDPNMQKGGRARWKAKRKR